MSVYRRERRKHDRKGVKAERQRQQECKKDEREELKELLWSEAACTVGSCCGLGSVY